MKKKYCEWEDYNPMWFLMAWILTKDEDGDQRLSFEIALPFLETEELLQAFGLDKEPPESGIFEIINQAQAEVMEKFIPGYKIDLAKYDYTMEYRNVPKVFSILDIEKRLADDDPDSPFVPLVSFTRNSESINDIIHLLRITHASRHSKIRMARMIMVINIILRKMEINRDELMAFIEEGLQDSDSYVTYQAKGAANLLEEYMPELYNKLKQKYDLYVPDYD